MFGYRVSMHSGSMARWFPGSSPTPWRIRGATSRFLDVVATARHPAVADANGGNHAHKRIRAGSIAAGNGGMYGRLAHVPEQCVPLFHDTASLVDSVVRKGQEANATALAGLTMQGDAEIENYWKLADQLAQLLGWQRDMFLKLTEAIKCLDRG